MKKILIGLLLLLAVLPLAAQNTAAQILDRTAEALRRAGGIEAAFTVKSDGATLASGTICLKGEKFVLETGDTKTWFDGCTQWTYLASTEEVNISEPTPEELQSINPYAWLALYKHGYKPSLPAGTSDATLYKVLLTAEGRQELQGITLFIRKSNNLPRRIVMRQRGGEEMEITITSCHTGRTYDAAFFVFDPKQYPDAELIDLR